MFFALCLFEQRSREAEKLAANWAWNGISGTERRNRDEGERKGLLEQNNKSDGKQKKGERGKRYAGSIVATNEPDGSSIEVFVGRGLAWRQVFHRHFIGGHLAASRTT